MTTDVLLVANDDDEWPAGVIELVGHRLSVARVNASKSRHLRSTAARFAF